MNSSSSVQAFLAYGYSRTWGGQNNLKVKVKSVYEPSGPSGRSLSRFL